MKKDKRYRFDAAACISLGKERLNNEDNFYLGGKYLSEDEYSKVNENIMSFNLPEQKERLLLGVCDGMGGEDYGEVASFIAAKSLCGLERSLSSAFCFDAEKCIKKHFNNLNNKVQSKQHELGVKCIGTTCAVLYLDKDGAAASSIGDSRIYQIREKKMRQLTVDHTELQIYIDSGLLTKEEGKNHPAGSCLTQFIGASSEYCTLSPSYAEINSYAAGDIFILCSDGLTDMLNDEDILRICQGKGSPADIARSLADEALQKGGWDNITVVAACVKKI